MIFVYEAANDSGSEINGELEAVDKNAALRELHRSGLTVTHITQAAESTSDYKRRSNKQDLLLSLHEMATLLDSGVSISETIDAQSKANYPLDLKLKYQEMADRVRSGATFSEAMDAAKFETPSYFSQLTKSGELTGNLALSLKEGVSQFEYDLKSQEEFRSAMIYPTVLVLSGVAAVLLIFLFVVPKFAPLVAGNDDLPMLSAMILGAGMLFNNNPGSLGLGALLVGGITTWLFQQQSVRDLTIKALFRTPIIGRWLNESDVATWTSLMASLLAAKVDLLPALELARNSARSEVRKTMLKQVEKEIKAGLGLADSLEKSKVLTPTGYNLIRSGERTGKLPQMMRSVAQLYEDAAKTRMKRALALIEPIAILIIGSVIGTIILGVILAITSVNQLVI